MTQTTGGFTSPTTQKSRTRAEDLWRCVMRQGRPIEDVAREHALSPRRLEQLLIALGKRRAQRLRSEAA